MGRCYVLEQTTWMTLNTAIGDIRRRAVSSKTAPSPLVTDYVILMQLFTGSVAAARSGARRPVPLPFGESVIALRHEGAAQARQSASRSKECPFFVRTNHPGDASTRPVVRQHRE